MYILHKKDKPHTAMQSIGPQTKLLSMLAKDKSKNESYIPKGLIVTFRKSKLVFLKWKLTIDVSPEVIVTYSCCFQSKSFQSPIGHFADVGTFLLQQLSILMSNYIWNGLLFPLIIDERSRALRTLPSRNGLFFQSLYCEMIGKNNIKIQMDFCVIRSDFTILIHGCNSLIFV